MEGNFDNLNPQESTPVAVRNVEKSEGLILSKSTVEELPASTSVGSELTFNNTIDSNPDEFNAIYMFEIAKKYNLDPKKDYEKIVQMSQDPSITEVLRKELEQDSLKSYTVTEIASVEKKPPVIKKDYDRNFFKKFDYLPNNGIAEVTDEELKDVDKIYIGTGIDMPAFKNMDRLGIYGDQNSNPTYFSTNYKVAMSHMQD